MILGDWLSKQTLKAVISRHHPAFMGHNTITRSIWPPLKTLCGNEGEGEGVAERERQTECLS